MQTPIAAMPILILTPMILCLFFLLRESVQRVFFRVYLPVFALFPVYYYWKVAALPPIDLAEATLLPLGLAMLVREMPRWRFSVLDLAMGLFLFSTFYADFQAGRKSPGIFNLFHATLLALVPYMAGKLLIEANGQRRVMVRRLTLMIFAAAVISIYEYRMEENPFTIVWRRFFPGELFAWKTQIRWGHGRVSGPYGQSELAGTIFFSALILALWLYDQKLWEKRFRLAPWLPWKKSTVIFLTLGTVLLLTQARGPWLGTLVALPVALVGRSKRPGRAALAAAAFILIAGSVTYAVLHRYSAVNAKTTSEAQQTAQYRQQLLDSYVPVAKAGGPWGWGEKFPRTPGLDSIDNEYLFIALLQGWVGLGSFCVLVLGTVYHLLRAGFDRKGARGGVWQQDRSFAWTLLGIYLGILLIIFTVFMGNQPYQLFFLLTGWAQALRFRRHRTSDRSLDISYETQPAQTEPIQPEPIQTEPALA